AFGPTEFKTLLAVYALVLAGCVGAGVPGIVTGVTWAFGLLVFVGAIQLVYALVSAVRDVNPHGHQADTTEWVTTRRPPPAQFDRRATPGVHAGRLTEGVGGSDEGARRCPPAG